MLARWLRPCWRPSMFVRRLFPSFLANFSIAVLRQQLPVGPARRAALKEGHVHNRRRPRLAPVPSAQASLIARTPAARSSTGKRQASSPVDARRAAQSLAAPVAQRAPFQGRIGFGREESVGARIADAVKVAGRDVDPVVIVPPAGLDHQYALAGIGPQAIGQQAAGGAAANDDVVAGRSISGSQPGPQPGPQLICFMIAYNASCASKPIPGRSGNCSQPASTLASSAKPANAPNTPG